MERMSSKKKSNESAGGSAKKSRGSGGDAVEFLKEKAQSDHSIRQQEQELQRKEQEARAREQARATDWTAMEATDRAANVDFTGIDDHDAKSG